MFKLFGRLKKEEPAPAQFPHQQQQQPAMSNEQYQAYPPQNAPQIGALHPQNRPPPEERVSFLLSRGLAESDIIKTLKNEGYSFQEIDSGITNVLKSTVSSEPNYAPRPSIDMVQNEELAPLMPLQPGPQPVPNASPAHETESQRMRVEIVEEMEEIMEALIEERVSKIDDRLDRLDARIKELDNKIFRLSEKAEQFEISEKTADSEAKTKMDELGEKEINLEPRISSLEKAFKDIIPNLVESVREVKEALSSSSLSRRLEPRIMQEPEASSDESASFGENKTDGEKSIFD